MSLNEDPVIRVANADDSEAIRRINLLALGYESGLSETADRLATIMRKPNTMIIVAEIEGSVAGYIHGSDYDCSYIPPLKNILALGVLEEYRGKGIGRALINALEEWAKTDGCAGVRLVSSSYRTGAHDFYLRCGYTVRKDQKNFIKWFGSSI